MRRQDAPCLMRLPMMRSRSFCQSSIKSEECWSSFSSDLISSLAIVCLGQRDEFAIAVNDLEVRVEALDHVLDDGSVVRPDIPRGDERCWAPIVAIGYLRDGQEVGVVPEWYDCG